MSAAVLVALACVTAWASGQLFLLSGRRRSDVVDHLVTAAGIGAILLLSAGQLLALAGHFGAATLLAAQVALLAVLAVAARRRTERARGSRWRRALASGLVVALLAPLVIYYATPVFDTRLEARDAGVYRLAALRLAREGSLAYRDPVVAGMSEPALDHFFPVSSGLSTARSMGFYFLDRDAGEVVPQFMPAAMVWMGIGALAAGHAGAEAALVVLAFLVSWAIYVLGRQFLGRPFAALAAAWLTMNLAQSWFVRYGTAEIVAQLLILVGCTLLLRHRESGDITAGLLAGWSLGLAPLAKIELFVLIVPAGLLLLADCATGRHRRPAWWSFWAAASAALALFFAQAWTTARPYVHDVLLNPGLTLSSFTLATGAGVVLLAAVRLAAPAWPRRWQEATISLLDMGNRAGVTLRIVLVSILAAFAVHGYWIRPRGQRWDSDNLVLLGWVTSEPGLLLAVVGLCLWLLHRRDSAKAAPVLLLLGSAALLVLWRKQIIPDLLWAYRRYLPVLLPLTFLAAAYSLHRLREAGRNHRPPWRVGALAASLLLGLLVTLLIGARAEFYESRRELAGAGDMVRTLAQQLPADAIVLFEPRTRRGLLRLEGAVEHAVGVPVVRLKSPRLERGRLRDLLLSQAREGRRVFLMTTGYLESPSWLHAEPVEGFFFETSRLEERFGELPREEERVAIVAKLYRILPDGDLERLQGELDVGGWDDLYLDGTRVYQTEGRPGQLSYRWVSGEGGFWLPGLEASDRRLQLTLAGGLPETPVTVILDGRELVRLRVRRGWRDYTVRVPEGWQPTGVPHLVLRSEVTFEAARVGSTGDPRTLGVAVDRIRWSPAAGADPAMMAGDPGDRCRQGATRARGCLATAADAGHRRLGRPFATMIVAESRLVSPASPRGRGNHGRAPEPPRP